MLLSILILVLGCDLSDSFIKYITLNTSHAADSGVNVHITGTHVTTTNDYWDIDPSTHDHMDIKIDLNSKWGFHSSIASTVTISIHGSTPNITQQDGAYILLFAVNNTHYFTVKVGLTDDVEWKLYPPTFLATNNDIFSNIIAKTGTTRSNRVSGNGQWVNVEPAYSNALNWPLTISITNNPINNSVHFECILNNVTLENIFNTSFASNQAMTVYIMNEQTNNKPFYIHSIDVSYSHYTTAPSSSPTISPITRTPSTSTPSSIPSIIAYRTTSKTTKLVTEATANLNTTFMNYMSKTEESMQISSQHLLTTISNPLVIGIICLCIAVVCGLVFCGGYIIGYKASHCSQKNNPQEIRSEETTNLKLSGSKSISVIQRKDSVQNNESMEIDQEENSNYTVQDSAELTVSKHSNNVVEEDEPDLYNQGSVYGRIMNTRQPSKGLAKIDCVTEFI